MARYAIVMDTRRCIGCLSCVMACPYGARIHNHETGAVQKCDFCKDRVDEGMLPHCVATCHQKARIFGDLDDDTSEVYKLLKNNRVVQLLGELKTEPYVFYIY